MRKLKASNLFWLVSNQEGTTNSVSRLIFSPENTNELFDRLWFLLQDKSDGNDRKDLMLKFLHVLKNYSITNALLKHNTRRNAPIPF